MRDMNRVPTARCGRPPRPDASPRQRTWPPARQSSPNGATRSRRTRAGQRNSTSHGTSSLSWINGRALDLGECRRRAAWAVQLPPGARPPVSPTMSQDTTHNAIWS